MQRKKQIINRNWCQINEIWHLFFIFFNFNGEKLKKIQLYICRVLLWVHNGATFVDLQILLLITKVVNFMNKNKTINIDLTSANKDFQMASIQDADLLRIKCYATHEGKNANGTIFPRKILLSCYRTFIDKPVWLVPDLNLHPSDHGYDFKRQKFDEKKRINVVLLFSKLFKCLR